MKCIELTRGQVAIVDDEDFAELSQWRWHLSSGGYAVRSQKMETGKNRYLFMHQAVLNTADGLKPDHINGNLLDNRRTNLRPATHSQNMCNRGACKTNKLGVKGVCWHKMAKKYVAQVQFEGRKKYLGSFVTVEEAKAARDSAAKLLHGEFFRS